MKMALCSYLVGSLLNLVKNCPRLISSVHSDSSVHYPLFLPLGYAQKVNISHFIQFCFIIFGSSINTEMGENNTFVSITVVGLIILQIHNKTQSLFHGFFFFSASNFGYRLGETRMHH